MEKRQSKIEQLVKMALHFMPVSSRSSGMMSTLGSFHPNISAGSPYTGTGKSHTHKGHVRAIKKHQRYRAFQKSLRRG